MYTRNNNTGQSGNNVQVGTIGDGRNVIEGNIEVEFEAMDLLVNNGRFEFSEQKHPADKDLSSWAGLGRSGNVQITTFGTISHIPGPKLSF